MSRISSYADSALLAGSLLTTAGWAISSEPQVAFPAGDYQRGEIVVSLNANGTTRGSTVDGVDWSRGTYVASGDRLQVTDLWVDEPDIENSCVDKGVGTYRWSLQGDQLSLALIDDACAPRAEGITRGPWTRR